MPAIVTIILSFIMFVIALIAHVAKVSGSAWVDFELAGLALFAAAVGLAWLQGVRHPAP